MSCNEGTCGWICECDRISNRVIGCNSHRSIAAGWCDRIIPISQVQSHRFCQLRYSVINRAENHIHKALPVGNSDGKGTAQIVVSSNSGTTAINREIHRQITDSTITALNAESTCVDRVFRGRIIQRNDAHSLLYFKSADVSSTARNPIEATLIRSRCDRAITPVDRGTTYIQRVGWRGAAVVGV